jgi:8-oxo-dGTP pyrophosphatase MutT (NUDIX family)
MSLIDKLVWIHVKDKQVLCARSHGKDIYYIPGGKREEGESDQQALMREIEEELSVRLIPESLKFAGQFKAQAHGKPEGTLVQMTCYFGDYEGTLAANSEIEELIWLKHKDKDKTAPVGQIILDQLKKQNLID